MLLVWLFRQVNEMVKVVFIRPRSCVDVPSKGEEKNEYALFVFFKNHFPKFSTPPPPIAFRPLRTGIVISFSKSLFSSALPLELSA